jgi:hypothetical protein
MGNRREGPEVVGHVRVNPGQWNDKPGGVR